MAQQIPRKNGNGDAPATEPARVNGASNGDTVVVACKIPNGLILQLQEKTTSTEQVLGGGLRDVTLWKKRWTKYVVKGPAYPVGTMPPFIIAGGYALTAGVPRDFWEQWVEQNKDADYVKNGFILAHSSQDAVVDEALNRAELRTGMEPMDPENPGKGLARFTPGPPT